MGKKIVILNGSTNKGNTSVLIESFKEGAKSPDNEIKCFHLQEMDIRGCIIKGPNAAENACLFKDDIDKIYPFYKEADVVVIVSPMYFWSISGHLRCAFDRLFLMEEIDENKSAVAKTCALIISSEKSSNMHLDPVQDFYASILKETGWGDVGKVFSTGVSDIESKSNPTDVEAARKLGELIK